MIVDIANSQKGALSGTSFAFPKPAGLGVGDAWVIHTTTEGNPTWTPPAGWTAEGQAFSPADVQQLAVFSKTIDGTEGATATFTPSGSESIYYWSWGTPGYGKDASQGSVSLGGTTNPITLDTGNVTPVAAATVLVWIGAPDISNGNTGTFTAPTGFSNLNSVPTASPIAAANHLQAMAIATKDYTTTTPVSASGGTYNASGSGRGLATILAFKTLGGGAAALAGGAVDVSTATGTLSASIKLTGAAVDVATATGGLSSQIKLTGAAVDTATASSSLSTNINLSGTAVDLSTATGTLNASAASLSASAQDVANATGDLTATIKLNATALASALASAGLNTSIQLAGNAQDQVVAVANIATQIKLSGSAQDVATAVATLAGTSAPMSAAAQAQASAFGQLTAQILMAGQARDVVTVTANLIVPVGLTANAISIAIAQGALTTQIKFSASAISNATASAVLSVGALVEYASEFISLGLHQQKTNISLSRIKQGLHQSALTKHLRRIK